MQTHSLDLLSLTCGLILTGITVVLALSLWTEVSVDLALLVPVALICSGVLVLVVALMPRRENPPPTP